MLTGFQSSLVEMEKTAKMSTACTTFHKFSFFESVFAEKESYLKFANKTTKRQKKVCGMGIFVNRKNSIHTNILLDTVVLS